MVFSLFEIAIFILIALVIVKLLSDKPTESEGNEPTTHKIPI
ncbi:MAG: hypothetical protein Q8R15_01395 [Candidatus Micrarchaeota archaeon]|nr:hypothetical protein [Candidatus Micrarchaeota archaeon]